MHPVMRQPELGEEVLPVLPVGPRMHRGAFGVGEDQAADTRHPPARAACGGVTLLHGFRAIRFLTTASLMAAPMMRCACPIVDADSGRPVRAETVRSRFACHSSMSSSDRSGSGTRSNHGTISSVTF